MTALAAVASYLPENRVPIEDLATRLDLTDRQVRVFRRFHGLSEVSRDSPDGTLLGMLVRAVAGLDGLPGQEHRVRYVIYARGLPVAVPYPMNPVHELCQQFGLEHAVAFTVTHHACATGLLGVDLAGRLLTTDGDPDALALVVTGEKVFTPDAELVPETSIFGDGAAACLVAADGPHDRLLSYVAQLRGDFDGRLRTDPDLGLRFAQAYPGLLGEVLLAAPEQAGLELSDIDLILPHNVNEVSWRRVCRRIGYPVERVLLDNVSKYGHCFASDPFINYGTAVERGMLSPGDRYMLVAAGLGAIFSAMVFEH